MRRSLRPPRTLRPTRAGWIFFALTFGVGFAALNTGNNLMYLVLAFMLSFLVLSGVLSESALRGVQVRRRLPREIFAESPAPIALEVRNAQRRVASFALVVEDVAAGAAPAPVGRAFALRVAPGGTETRTYPFEATERGRFALAGCRVSTRFPFGLFSKALWLDLPAELLAYPAVDPIERSGPEAAGRREGERSRPRGGSGSDVASLREFVHGDSWRRVHWRASLRRSELVVREPETDEDGRVVVSLRIRTAPGPAFERAVRRAASEVVAFLDQGLQVALRTEAQVLVAGHGPEHRARLLAFLAEVQAQPDETAT